MVRDSAGVTIVESLRPRWETNEVWQVGQEPSLRFGSDEALFRIVGARRLPDGRIVLGHASVPEIQTYSSDGTLLQGVGQRGAGPGEFQEFSRFLRTAGDSIAIYDYPNHRLSVLDPEGGYGRSFSTPSLPNSSLAFVEDAFSDGSFLVTPFGGPPTGQGMVRRVRELWRVNPDGTSAIELVSFPELEQYFFSQVSGQQFRRPFFGKTSYYLAAGDRLIWGMTDAFSLFLHDLDGRLVSIYRSRQPDRSFGRSDVEPLIERILSQLADENVRRLRRTALHELPATGAMPAWGWPDYGPAFGPALQLDVEGNLWIAQYYLPDDVQNRRTVLSAGGEWLGTVDLPIGFAPHHIGDDFILGVWRDELDVEEVRLYSLIKPRS